MKDEIKIIVHQIFGVDNFKVTHRKERQRVARQVYAWLLKDFLNMHPNDIAREIGRDRSTVYACFKVQKKLHKGKYKDQVQQCIRMALNLKDDYIIGRFYWIRYRSQGTWSKWMISQYQGFCKNKYTWSILLTTTVKCEKDKFQCDGEIKHI